jgi:UTP--glucose-1-phosphate uridylyltransferase
VKIKKAVITAAAERQRALPLQTLIDRDGEEKSVLGIMVEQALSANVEEVCVVVWPGDEERYAQAVGRHLGHVRFAPQPRPLGYGDALCCGPAVRRRAAQVPCWNWRRRKAARSLRFS